MKCKYHLCTNILGGKKKVFCSKKCAVKFHVSENRRKYKEKAVQLLGGKCIKCGYNKCVRALQFHHLDPSQKEFGLSSPNNMSWIKYEIEVLKCILLCANCHAEEEDRLYRLSVVL